MRDIKFRAWDNKAKEWLLGYDQGDLGGFSLFGECILLGEWGHILNEFILQQRDRTPQDLIVMQYTGLKDKNGKEIYEGDIIMFLDRDWMDYEKDTKRLPVVYEEDKFIIKGGEDKYGQYYEYPLFKSYGRDRFEVIGNIYQNPELTIVSPEKNL